MIVEVEAVWNGDRFLGPTRYAVGEGMLRRVPEGVAAGAERVAATLIPHLTDHHVHLGLSDAAALFRGGITDAVDLGWVPGIASGWLADDPERPAVGIAGALLTAVGGYPARAGWAPAGSCVQLATPDDAVEAVRAQRAAGASRIKATLNTDAGPTMDDETLRAVVGEAHAAGLPVTAHVQGAGQTARALRAGVDQLAHAPFSERVGDDLLRRAAAQGVSWVSTLDIHGWGRPTREFAIAQDNVRRYARAGGRILYGTDLGNGPLAVGVSARELAALAGAGLDATRLLQAIAGDGTADVVGPRFALVPGFPPDSTDELPAWLATARGRTADRILDTLQENP